MASALRGFARQFRIEGIPRHGPREFMQMARRYSKFNERKSTDEGQDDFELRNDKKRTFQ